MNFNVIAVHWNPLATWDNYFIAANNAVRVGQHAGQVIGIDLLMNGLRQTPDQIHAIGHSLGAHLVGHIGRSVEALIGEKIARVTGNWFTKFYSDVHTKLLKGLDPAKPYFDIVGEERRLQPTDAAQTTKCRPR